LIWPHCAGLIWPHPGVGLCVGGSFLAAAGAGPVAAGAGSATCPDHPAGRTSSLSSSLSCTVCHVHGAPSERQTTLSEPSERAANAAELSSGHFLAVLCDGSSPVANLQQQTAATKAQPGGGGCDYSRLARHEWRSTRPAPPLCQQGVRGSSPLGSTPSQSRFALAWRLTFRPVQQKVQQR
jgi:hypothetical protein